MVSSPFHRITVITTELTQHMINLIVETFNVAVELLCGFRACAWFPGMLWRRRGRASPIFSACSNIMWQQLSRDPGLGCTGIRLTLRRSKPTAFIAAAKAGAYTVGRNPNFNVVVAAVVGRGGGRGGCFVCFGAFMKHHIIEQLN